MSGATNTVDVLVTIDADHLIETGDVANSVSLLVRRDLVDPNATGSQTDGGNELWFDVKRNDNVRWRGTTLSRNFDRTALITNVIKGNPTQGGHYDGVITDPQLIHAYDAQVAYLVDATSKKVASNSVTYSLWQSTAEKAGKLWYQIEFIILDQELNQIGGTHTWDPYITVNN